MVREIGGHPPITNSPLPGYSHTMKHKTHSPNQSLKPAGAARSTAAANSDRNKMDFAPSADEVARRAYASYVNQGSLPGHDVEHWLAAEGQLLAEHRLT
jgi:hypothetical protein